MFDIGWSEMFVIGVIALVVIGPKELPRVMRQIGRYFGKAKRMTGELRRHWDDIMRESELDDMKREIQSAVSSDPSTYIERAIDPNREIRETIEFGGEELVNVKMPELPSAAPMASATADAAPAAVTAVAVSEPKDGPR